VAPWWWLWEKPTGSIQNFYESAGNHRAGSGTDFQLSMQVNNSHTYNNYTVHITVWWRGWVATVLLLIYYSYFITWLHWAWACIEVSTCAHYLLLLCFAVCFYSTPDRSKCGCKYCNVYCAIAMATGIIFWWLWFSLKVIHKELIARIEWTVVKPLTLKFAVWNVQVVFKK